MTPNDLLWFVSQMLPARLFRQAKTQNRNIILTALILAGVALAMPHAAKAQGCDDWQASSPPVCIGWWGNASKNQGAPSSGRQGGDPVDLASGNMYYHVTDYTTHGQNPLEFTRYYNSMAPVTGEFSYAAGMIGVAWPVVVASWPTAVANWRDTYDRYLQFVPSSSPTQIIAERADGQQLVFALSGSTWVTDGDVDYTLTHSGSTWTLTDHNDTAESYTDTGSGQGVLNTITKRNGYQQTLSYTAATGCAGGTVLCSVTDSYGRTLSFTYSGGVMTQLTTPDSLVVTYGYSLTNAIAGGAYYSISGGNALTSVSYNTSPTTSQSYSYSGTYKYPLLNSVTDENGNTSVSWTYDVYGRATSSKKGGSLAANSTSISYSAFGLGATVTNAFGVVDTYTFSIIQGVSKVTEIDRASTGTTAAAHEYFTYDSNGFLSDKKDWDGNETTYTNNSHGDPTSITEGYGSAVARTTTIAYDATWIHE